MTKAKRIAWSAPRRPGDTVRIEYLKRGDEIGNIRIQDYMDSIKTKYRYKIGSFLPGEIQESSGDTPKVWPEKHKVSASVAQSNKQFNQYVNSAICDDGWIIDTEHRSHAMKKRKTKAKSRPKKSPLLKAPSATAEPMGAIMPDGSKLDQWDERLRAVGGAPVYPKGGDAKDSIKPAHQATAKRIASLLQEATENGTLDELAAFIHPDIINGFCDGISDMVGEKR